MTCFSRSKILTMPAYLTVVAENIYAISWRASVIDDTYTRSAAVKLTSKILCRLECTLDEEDEKMNLMVKLRDDATRGIPILPTTPIIYATINNIWKKLTATDEPGAFTTWEACWLDFQRCELCQRDRPCTLCRNVAPLASFEILINMAKPAEKPEANSLIKPGQKNVLNNMEKILMEASLADVTFTFPSNSFLFASKCY